MAISQAQKVATGFQEIWQNPFAHSFANGYQTSKAIISLIWPPNPQISIAF
jgi:hypothetical protein